MVTVKLSTESFTDEGSFERNRTRCDFYSSVAIYHQIFNKAYAALHALLRREGEIPVLHNSKEVNMDMLLDFWSYFI